MRLSLTLFLSLFLVTGFAQTASQYFDQIRNNEAALTAFFTQMPKGGDLHHHFGGSVYAESMLEMAIAKNLYVNKGTMQVSKEKPVSGNWERFDAVRERGELSQLKDQLMRKWSVKDYDPASSPSANLFFESFDKFYPALEESFEPGLLELKARAVKENVSYIETQLATIHNDINLRSYAGYNSLLRKAAASKNEQQIFQLLDSLNNYLVKVDVAGYANRFNSAFVAHLHNFLSMDDQRFTIRYQNFVLRFMEPVDLFKNMVLAFVSADRSPLIDGVNIVSPEHGETSLKDYWLHMVMFKYCHARYPKVKYALHAGELTLGLVPPEELTWHIRSAVYTAGANRIGHGVDVAYEEDCYELLNYMAGNKIPVEINLASNEFILNVKEGRHPVTLYKEFGVPIVLSTDDAGVLRTNLTEQFVLLAKRYKEFSYADIKQLVYNSIQYSFIENPELKQRLLKDLDNRFYLFESKIAGISGNK